MGLYPPEEERTVQYNIRREKCGFHFQLFFTRKKERTKSPAIFGRISVSNLLAFRKDLGLSTIVKAGRFQQPRVDHTGPQNEDLPEIIKLSIFSWLPETASCSASWLRIPL